MSVMDGERAKLDGEDTHAIVPIGEAVELEGFDRQVSAVDFNVTVGALEVHGLGGRRGGRFVLDQPVDFCGSEALSGEAPSHFLLHSSFSSHVGGRWWQNGKTTHLKLLFLSFLLLFLFVLHFFLFAQELFQVSAV